MTIVNYSYVKDNLKSIIDKVNQDKGEVIIVSEVDCNVVVIAEETYNQLIETLYLLSNPANIKHLSDSMDQYHEGNII